MGLRKILFIEGVSDSPNGNLRQGFEKLLSKKLTGKMPKINMGGSKNRVRDQFLNNRLDGIPLLLVDLDANEDQRELDLEKNKLTNYRDSIFFMVQEMESWFLSQPDMLDEYYGPTKTNKKISDSIPKRIPADIPNPKELLKKATKDLNKGEVYHEVKHAVDLLLRLDASKLENDFPDFKRLIEQLK